MAKVYLSQNVFDAALERIRRLFREFPTVLVDFSGGKDSTVVLNLALRVAGELGRLPLTVFWLDQEAEWDSVVTYVRSVMNRPDVDPLWFQGPFKLFNATTTSSDPWLYCWQPGAEWIRPKEPNSIHENRCGTDRFKELFSKVSDVYFRDQPVARLAGVRCEESPGRLVGLTGVATYQDITWGKVDNRKLGHYTFYPLYDWTLSDVWKAIHANGWSYCSLYDRMYQYGIAPHTMRVSNVHHETAIHVLKFLQEIEPETWNKITARVGSVNAVSQLREAYEMPKELPPMFASWREYRDHLLVNLIDPQHQASFRSHWEQWDTLYKIELPHVENDLVKMEIASILVNDLEFTKYDNFRSGKGPTYRRNVGTHRDRFSPKP